MRAERISRAVGSVFLAVALAMLLIPGSTMGFLGGASQAAYAVDVQASGIQTMRIAGDKAADTSCEIARNAYPEGCVTAVIARSDDYYDAMSASGLAGVLDAPILLTSPSSLAGSTANTLKDLGVERVYIVGGPQAISTEVESSLVDLGLAVEQRVFGAKACNTSVECAKLIEQLSGNPRQECIVATSSSFMDAVSISSYAYKFKVPLLIETPAYTTEELALTEDSVPFLERALRILVVGGVEAVPERVVEDYGDGSFRAKTLRMAGAFGYDTSKEIAETLCAEGSLSMNVVGLATGEAESKGVDALSASALCAKYDAPVLLVNIEGNSSTVNQFLVSNQDSVSSAVMFGGTDVIPDGVFDYIRKVVNGSLRYTAILGTDEWQPQGYAWHLEGSDLQMLLCSDSEAGKIWLVSVPRDYYYDAGRGKYKSNYVFNFAYYDAQAAGKSAAECEAIAAEATCDMLGDVFNVSVKNYAVTDLNRFTQLVDSIDGVGTPVPYDILYDFYPMHNLEANTYENPFEPIYYAGGYYNFDGFMASSLARARTSNLGGPQYSDYGLEQDATRQSIDRQIMMSLIEKAFSVPNAAGFVQPLIDNGLIRTNMTAQQVSELLVPFQQKGSFTIYGTSGPVKGDLTPVPGDLPWLIPEDTLFYKNIMQSVRTGRDTAWLGQYYGVKQDWWMPICFSKVVNPA